MRTSQVMLRFRDTCARERSSFDSATMWRVMSGSGTMITRGARFFGQSQQAAYHPEVLARPGTLNLSSLASQEPILPRVAAGEAGAMNLCIDRYGALVWALARRHIKNHAEAEDFVQEVFTEIWKKAGTFNPEVASEATFIGLVTRRRAIDFMRRQGRKPEFEPLTAAESYPEPDAGTSSLHCDTEAVKSSLASLPPDTRQLFSLFFEDGFTHPEIAEKTGLPLGTVKTRLRRGLVALRDQLARAGFSTTQRAS